MQESGLFIGRFQPLHRGHMFAIRDCAKQAKLLIIAIGSPQESGTYKNPFTLEERKEMINRAMKEIGTENYRIIELPDTATDTEWLELVKKQAGKIDMAWSGNELVVRLFKTARLPIKRLHEYPGFSATKIRRRICTRQPWLRFVPLSLRSYLKEIKAAQRIWKSCSKV